VYGASSLEEGAIFENSLLFSLLAGNCAYRDWFESDCVRHHASVRCRSSSRDWQPTRNKALAQVQAYPSSTLDGQASLPPTAYDEGEHVKEAFAHFGRAIYMASLVETGLVHVLLQADFLTKVKNAFVKGKGQDFSREKYETDFDAFMQEHFGQTMGNLIKRFERQLEFDEKLKKRVSTAKGRRDYLVHHFWRDRAVRFGTKDGRDQIIAELSEDAEKFEALDKDVRSALKPVREKLGIKERLFLNRKIRFAEKALVACSF
jgi:hypothetical protein